MSDIEGVPSVVRTQQIYETDQNGTREEALLINEPAYVPEPFTLTVGLEYVTQGRETIKIVYQAKDGRFLGIWEYPAHPVMQFWYTTDGFINDIDRIDNDPFDIKRLHRDPDTIYLLKKDGKYTGNSCFMSLEAAQTASSERGGRVIPFKEVMDD